MEPPPAPTPPPAPSWKKVVTEFQQPSLPRSLWQLVNSACSYVVLVGLIFLNFSGPLWLVIPMILLAGGLMVRIFIIFHDCTHGSFFRNRRANEIVGFITGVLCFTPFQHWKWEHSVHHANAGDLDGRGLGDVWTMTVKEYLSASRVTRIRYRLNRHPIVLFVLAPIFLFLVLHRLSTPGASAKARASVHWTNFTLAIMAGLLIWAFGWQAYLVIQLSILFIAATAGVWLFYIQHQFEGVAWERSPEWDFTQAALEGSSFYRLPRILQWFSGNIGFHHIHHLSPRIPNYRLESCHEADETFRSVTPVTLRSSFKSFRFRLWDEENRRLVGFDHVRRMPRGPGTSTV